MTAKDTLLIGHFWWREPAISAWGRKRMHLVSQESHGLQPVGTISIPATFFEENEMRMSRSIHRSSATKCQNRMPS